MSEAKLKRYGRLSNQIAELIAPVPNPVARMATITAVLHHKIKYFFWTGFYLLDQGNLYVGPYQGPLACLKLKENTGVCWAGIMQQESIIVPDVEKFPGHIACSSLSKSEIVIPLKDQAGKITGVFDVDSRELNAFDEIDRTGLEQIINMVYLSSNL